MKNNTIILSSYKTACYLQYIETISTLRCVCNFVALHFVKSIKLQHSVELWMTLMFCQVIKNDKNCMNHVSGHSIISCQ